MIKKTLLLLGMLFIIGYLVIAVTAFNVKPSDQVCEDIELVIKDSLNAGFITKKEINTLLKKKKINLVGEKMEYIHCDTLENLLATHPLIDEVECYKTPGGKINIEVTQRVPILRIMPHNGENYFIDNKGGIMPNDAKCVANLAIVTGNIEKAFAMKELYHFGLFLQNNKFWNAQIQQINVLAEKEIEFVPRVGNHIVFMGKLNNYEEKLNRLKEFYTKGLNTVGWNKYSRINIEFANQIICTKAE